MLNKFNSFMEKWMPFVTPVCLMVGVLFPDIARHGVPYVTYVFAFMTFIGALKSRFRDIANVFKRPLPLILMFLVLHILIPVTAYGVGLLFFPENINYITGIVLEFSVPVAVISLMWVSIYNGNNPLSLSLVILDTILSPFLIPATLKILVGSNIKMDTAGMMKELVFMIALPAVIAMCLNEFSHGKVMETWPKKTCTFFKNVSDFCGDFQFLQGFSLYKASEWRTSGCNNYNSGTVCQRICHWLADCHSYKTE